MADAEEEEESVAPGSGAAEHERYEKAIEELRAEKNREFRSQVRPSTTLTGNVSLTFSAKNSSPLPSSFSSPSGSSAPQSSAA